MCFKSCCEVKWVINYMVASSKFHLAHIHIQTLLMAKAHCGIKLLCIFMTGFSPRTGCIHLLKCIKWKSSTICIKRVPRLSGFGEVMLFIHHEEMVFFTVTL